MGGELKRVPMDFDWPMGETWYGFINPYRGSQCVPCKGSGYNPETKLLADAFYSHSAPDHIGWNDKLTQDEVDHLVEKGRLGTFVDGKWQPVPLSVDAVNESNQVGGIGYYKHDGINRHYLIVFRATKMGIFGECKWCQGEGDLWADQQAPIARR